MTDAPTPRPGWPWLLRWGPFALLGLGALVSAATAPALMTPAVTLAAAVLTAAALGWQLAWDRRLPRLPEQSPPRAAYFTVRTAFALALAWLNPFFSIFALMGYFDAKRHLPDGRYRWGLLAVAASLAISQSTVPTKPAPSSTTRWIIFFALFMLHASLALLLDRFSNAEAVTRRKQRAAIQDLEIANSRLEQALAENESLQARLLAHARETGILDERRRIAAEIHDTLAQGLAGILTQLQAAANSPDERTASRHLAHASALARDGLAEARRSVHNLTPSPLVHRTLPEALEEKASGWAAGTPVRLDLTITGTVEPLHEELEATLLRITEEALRNVSKHARASRVGITLSYMDDEVTLDVRDDGRGFDPGQLPPRSDSAGFGLAGMRSRARRMAGHLMIESEPGEGTAVSARLPLVRHDA